MAKTLMIQGTSSSVGKSLLTAALCRIFYRKGLKVVPFKAQNMALNSFVTSEGLEIGRAQVVQAQAAGIEPRVDMNPVLLKPETDNRCQVVVMGKPWKTLQAGKYYRQGKELWDAVTSSLERLHGEYDLIIIEGAGSPAEINLKQKDIVNMRVARHLNAPVILAGDIDRGGIFAQLYGTLELLEPEEKALVRGFIINKFRGDVRLLEPGIEMLTDLVGGIPTLGVVPYIKDILLAQEDSVFLDEVHDEHRPDGGIDIAVIRLPHISNYDDFDPFINEKGVGLRFVDSVRKIGYPDAVIIPGTKTTISDLLWLKETGLADTITGLSKSGVAVCGICGGFQMLGTFLDDSDGVEGKPSRETGLGLLQASTFFSRTKHTAAGSGRIDSPSGFLNGLKGCEVSGYEIHMGTAVYEQKCSPILVSSSGLPDGGISADGRVWGTYFHGIFDNDNFRSAWLKSLGWSGAETLSFSLRRDAEIERLADTVERAVDMSRIEKIIGF